MRFTSRRSKLEKIKIEKARKQLLGIGVICVSVVIFIIWLMNLDNTFERNRQEYNQNIEINKDFSDQFSNKWKKFKEQLAE